MREFCLAPDCDGLVSTGGHPIDGDIGTCEKCGRQYVITLEIRLEPLEDLAEGKEPKYGTLVQHSIFSGEKIAEIKLEKD